MPISINKSYIFAPLNSYLLLSFLCHSIVHLVISNSTIHYFTSNVSQLSMQPLLSIMPCYHSPLNSTKCLIKEITGSNLKASSSVPQTRTKSSGQPLPLTCFMTVVKFSPSLYILTIVHDNHSNPWSMYNSNLNSKGVYISVEVSPKEWK